MTALGALGWNDIRALKNTFADYVDVGYAVAEGLPEDPMLLDAAQPDADLVSVMDLMFSSIPEGYGVIKAEDLNLLLGESLDMKLIDVRRLEELEEKGVIDSGDVELTHIALEDFIAEKGMWPENLDDQIVTYCGSGHRSTMVVTILWSYLYGDVESLKDGFTGYQEAGFPTAEFVAQ
jgi:rhodanese-related sulfurtransferase